MKRILIAALAGLTAAALTGCEKPAGPKTTEIEAVERPAADLIPAPTPADTATVEPAPAPPATPAQVPPPSPERGYKLHTVQKGETLMSIARKYYDNAGRYKDIAKANNISEPDKIHIGQVLKIPD